jgi:hypothetical protein
MISISSVMLPKLAAIENSLSAMAVNAEKEEIDTIVGENH